MFLQFDLKILARKFEQSQVGLTGLIKSQISQIFLCYSSFFTPTLLYIKELNGLDPKLLQFLDAYMSFKEPSGLDTSV